MSQYRNILVIALHKLGDNVQVTPVFRALKLHHPGAFVALLTERGFEDCFKGNPHIDRMFCLDRGCYTGRKIASAAQLKREACPAVAESSAHSFDLILNRQSSAEGALLTSHFGAPEIRGLYFSKKGEQKIDDPWTRLLFAMAQFRRINPFNLVDYNINVAGGSDQRKLDLFFDSAAVDETMAAWGLSSGQPVVAVQAGAAESRRRWTREAYARTIELMLKEKFLSVVLTGSPAEAAECEALRNALPQPLRSRVVNAARQLPVSMLPAFLSRCRLLVTNDTGPMHVAAAAGCPVVALYFGGSFPYETGPYSPGNFLLHAKLPCLPCTLSTPCERDFVCKPMISPDVVAGLALHRLGAGPAPDQVLLETVQVLRSGALPSASELLYTPFFRVPITSEDLFRFLYTLIFKSHLSGKPVSEWRSMAEGFTGGFSKVRALLNGAVDLPMGPLMAFSANVRETRALHSLAREAVLLLRDWNK